MSNSVFGLRLGDSEHQFLEEAADGTDGILSKAGVVRVLIRQAMDSGWEPLTSQNCVPKFSAYQVGAGNRFGYDQKLPLQFPPQLEVTNTEAQHSAVPSQELETSKKDTVVISKKKRSVKTKGCEAFETFWKTYTAFEHRANGQTKPKALEAWNKATKDVTPDQLLEALGKAQDEISDKVANQTFYSSMPDCHRWLKGEQYAVYLEGNTTVQSNNNIW